MLTVPKGNLIRNPGFELGLDFWRVPMTMPYSEYFNVAAYTGEAHSGLASLYFNVFDPSFLAVVYQDVRVSPGCRYELDFSIAGEARMSVNFLAEVHWLDDDNEDLGIGLAILVNHVGSAASGEWVLHSGITEEAPLAGRRARISLASSFDTGVLVDDVLFFKSE